jgi:hypothetical protein
MKIDLVVSRHPAAIEFVAEHLMRRVVTDGHGHTWLYPYDDALDNDAIPVLASATADDVRGKVVAGNLPMHLACLCQEVLIIEFAATAPRGQEYTLADMQAAGAKMVPYLVRQSEAV